MQKELWQAITAFFLTILVLYALLTVSACIPNSQIADHMLESALHYGNTEAYGFESGDKLHSVSDNYADCVLLAVSYYMGEGNPFTAALDTKYYRGEKDALGVNTAFFLTLTENTPADTDYSRYWHGMAAFVRIIHLFGNVQTVKWIGFAAFLLFALGTLALLVRQKNYKTALALLAALLCIHFWNLRISMEYQSPFVLCFLLCPLYICAERKQDRLLPVFSVIGGVMTAFFDFLTCETVVILLPLLLVIAIRIEENRFDSFRNNFSLLLVCGICFFAAYAGTFLAKWSLASLFTGENKFALALSSAELHVAGDDATGIAPENTFVRILLAPIANLTVLFGGTERIEGIRVLLGLLLAAAILGSFFYLFKKKNIDRGAAGLLLLLGAFVFLRYWALNYHSYAHAFFTYRALAAPIFAVFSSILLCAKLPHKRKEVRKK